MATECKKDETAGALLKVTKGSVQFTTNIYKASDSCVNYSSVEGCSKTCIYVLSRIYTSIYFIVDNIAVCLTMSHKIKLYFLLSCY